MEHSLTILHAKLTGLIASVTEAQPQAWWVQALGDLNPSCRRAPAIRTISSSPDAKKTECPKPIVAVISANAGRQIASILQSCCPAQHAAVFQRTGQALRTLPKINPEVILVDCRFPRLDLPRYVRQLKQIVSQSIILLLIEPTERSALIRGIMAGARGCITWPVDPKELVQSLQICRRGKCPMSSAAICQLVDHLQSLGQEAEVLCPLSNREREVMQLLVEGRMYKEIAHALGLSLDTVRRHISRLYSKLGVRSRTDAVVKFLSS